MTKLLIAGIFMALVTVSGATGVAAAPTKAQGPKAETPKTFVGTVTAVDTTAGTVTIDAKKKGAVTATVITTTPVVDAEGNTISLSDISAGEKVKLQGTYNKTTSSFSTVKQVKDLSLPSPTPTPTP